MAKKLATKGIIELKQEELSATQEEIDDNARQYKAYWEERNIFLEAGEVMKVQELEGKYYHLRDNVAKQLDRKRIEIDMEIEELQAEAFRLKKGMSMDVKILDRQKQELQALKKEYQDKLADKQQSISDTEFILQQAEQRIIALEGGE
ncbi:hypothetical protein L604_000700000870 [Bacillus subtilis J27]|uniref:hypothetical protein n=1 Tax=Bacillus subtilis TaxID=1423 RepID=UPI00119D5B3D|nr:hypothetical protein [Bacillus subtilis]TWG74392.1 hypothetical protein L604_000700000870 [Bacillus subtilis J27]